MPGSATQYFCPPAYLPPLKAVVGPQSNPRCQNRWAVTAAGNLQYCRQVAADAPVQVGKKVFLGAVGVCEAVQTGGPVLLSDFFCGSHPAGEYIGYT